MIEARDAGVNEFLAKPICAAGLYGKIRSVMERPRPFVHSDDFFGPDRRRKRSAFIGTERRQRMSLSREEIAALLHGGQALDPSAGAA